MDDSSEDLFITQSAPEYEFLEQNEEYDCSYLDSQYEDNWSIPLGDVEYWDFSNQPDNSSVAPTLPLDYRKPVEKGFEKLVSDDYFAEDKNVSLLELYLFSC